MRRILALTALALLATCATTAAPNGDAMLATLQNAHFRECPADRSQPNARTGMDGAAAGVESVDLAFAPIAGEPARAIRLRRLTVAPAGVIAWHAHDQIQGMAVIVSGEMTEYRNTCLDPMIYRAGDIAREDAATAHGWRNASSAPAVILVMHVVARP